MKILPVIYLVTFGAMIVIFGSLIGTALSNLANRDAPRLADGEQAADCRRAVLEGTGMSVIGVRRDKAALSSGCKARLSPNGGSKNGPKGDLSGNSCGFLKKFPPRRDYHGPKRRPSGSGPSFGGIWSLAASTC
jgi:hypothetical protein